MADTYVSLSSMGFVNLRGAENAIQYQDEMYLKSGTPLWGDITHRRDGIYYDPEADILVPFHSVLKMTREIEKSTLHKPEDVECVVETTTKETVFKGTVGLVGEPAEGAYFYPFLPNIAVEELNDTLYVSVDGTNYIFTKDMSGDWTVVPESEEGPSAILVNGDELELAIITNNPPASVYLDITQDSDGGDQPGPK